VTTVAGGPDRRGHRDGDGAVARFEYPSYLAVASDGTIFSLRIRRLLPSG
jgi:hypothetical protein